MFRRLFSPRAKPSPLDRAEAEAASKVQCQRVAEIRVAKQRATVAGLLANVDDDARARFTEAMGRVSALGRAVSS